MSRCRCAAGHGRCAGPGARLDAPPGQCRHDPSYPSRCPPGLSEAACHLGPTPLRGLAGVAVPALCPRFLALSKRALYVSRTEAFGGGAK